jgi:predicted nucleic acid-binding protein
VLIKDERGIFGNWQSLVVAQSLKGKSAHDARLVAAMQRHRLSNMLTFNTPDFTRFNNVQVFSPADEDPLRSTLRPDQKMI